MSNQTKTPSAIYNKTQFTLRSRKRSHESKDNVSITSRSTSCKPSSSKIIDKRPRIVTENVSDKESDFDENTTSQFSGETDSDEPLLHKCNVCDREFLTKKSLSNHSRTHTRANEKKLLQENAVVDIPTNSGVDIAEDEKVHCEKCGKIFKLKIMLKRHYEICPNRSIEKKEPKIELDNATNDNKNNCEICFGNFKTIENLEKHMRVVHAAVLKKTKTENVTPEKISNRISVPCVFCHKTFGNFITHNAHFDICTKRSNIQTYICLICRRKFNNKNTYLTHLKNDHFAPQTSVKLNDFQEAEQELYDCRLCNEKLTSQQLLISHLASHMSNVDGNNDASVEEENSR